MKCFLHFYNNSIQEATIAPLPSTMHLQSWAEHRMKNTCICRICRGTTCSHRGSSIRNIGIWDCVWHLHCKICHNSKIVFCMSFIPYIYRRGAGAGTTGPATAGPMLTLLIISSQKLTRMCTPCIRSLGLNGCAYQ